MVGAAKRSSNSVTDGQIALIALGAATAGLTMGLIALGYLAWRRHRVHRLNKRLNRRETPE
jgi:hypothetical protein